MKTLDVTYDKEFYKAENEKSDKVYNAEMEALPNFVLLLYSPCIMCFLILLIPVSAIQVFLKYMAIGLFVILFSIWFYKTFLMKKGNIPDALENAVIWKKLYDKNSESFFVESKNEIWLVLLNCGNGEDNLAYAPLQVNLKNIFKYENEIPKEWETLHISVTNDGVSTVSFT